MTSNTHDTRPIAARPLGMTADMCSLPDWLIPAKGSAIRGSCLCLILDTSSSIVDKSAFLGGCMTQALLDIYRPYVVETPVSFETSVPDVSQFAARIQKALAGWQWLVAEMDGKCVGYAYASSHRERAAYRWSIEVSAYVPPAFQRRGIGRLLYDDLLADAARKGFCNAYAGITMPNEASIALHRRAGFETIGVFRAVGRKFGRWHDVLWVQRKLLDAPPREAS